MKRVGDDDPKRIDYFGAFQVGVPKDIGWAIVVLHEDRTVTRTCKGCGVTARSTIGPAGRVAEAEIHHLWPGAWSSRGSATIRSTRRTRFSEIPVFLRTVFADSRPESTFADQTAKVPSPKRVNRQPRNGRRKGTTGRGQLRG